MKQFLRGLTITFFVLAVTAGAFAQTTAGLTGTVTTNGSALPGATVTIASPAMQGTRSAVTGEAGGYIFSGLPPGVYTVTFELAGMQTSTQRAKLNVGQTGRADAEMKVSAVAEAITVTASAPSVLETPTVSTNISGKLIDQLPIARTVLATALLAPGVNDNTPSGSQLSISGSPGYDNLVMVNGVAITESIRHQSLNLFIEDAIQETTVMTGAISAEYGGFTGGVVNSITKTGGNQFSGSLRDSLTSPDWQRRTPLQIKNNTKLLHDISGVYEGTLGGYILRDRLWFFAAGRKNNGSTQASLRTVPLGDATRSALSVTTGTDEKRWEGKLTGQITDKHNVTVSYLDVNRVSTNSFFTATSYDLEQLSNRSDPQKLKSAHYNGILTQNWLIEGQYSAMDWGVANGSGSQFTDVIRGTIVRNRADSNARFNSPTFCGVCDKETRSNNGWNLKTHYFLSSTGLGNHDIVGGVERFSEHRHANNFQSGSNFRVFVNSVQRLNNVLYPTVLPAGQGATASSAAFIFWSPILSLQAGESDLASDSLFINDRWDLNSHFSFSLGARYDKNDAVDGTGNPVSKDSKITPRVNMTYDPLANGRHRINLGYAQYVSRIVDGPATAASSAGTPASIYFQYLGPAINPAGTPANELVDTHQALQTIFDWFNSACNAQGKCGAQNLDLLHKLRSSAVPGADTRIDKSLGSPYVSEVTLGYGTQWFRNFVTRVDLVTRDWKDFYGYQVTQSSVSQTTDSLGIVHDVATVVNTNDVTRKYRGLQFQTAWNPGRFNTGLNATLSKLRGNDEQESSNSGTVGNSPGSIYYPELSNFSQRLPEGYLSQDERTRIRAWVGYDIPTPRIFGRINVAVLQNFDSGTPYSAVGSVDLSPYADTLLGASSKYETAPLSRQYYFSKRGEFRLPNISSTNLALNYAYPIGRVELFASGEMLNVFNHDAVAAVNTSISSADTSANFLPFNPYTDTPKECPQGTSGANCKAMGANWQKGVNFGIPTSATAGFQTPRTWRFQAGIRF